MKPSPYLSSGRATQKLRTRKALTEAASRIIAKGEELTVAAAAEAAGVSKATAYRYFTSAETLALEAPLDMGFAEPDAIIGDDPDVRLRVRRVAEYLHIATAQNERGFRLFLASALQASVQPDAPQLRGARRLPMFELALAPVRAELGEARFRRLVHALSGATGLEAFVALHDVCRIRDQKEALAVLMTTVDALLDAFLPPRAA